MNIFKKTILILALVTQAAPVVLAGATLSKPEVASQGKKVAAKIRNIAPYVGAGVFSAAAVAGIIVSGGLLFTSGEDALKAWRGSKDSDSQLQNKKLRALRFPLGIVCLALSLGSGKLAQLCYKKARQVQAPEEKKQK
jgi:hypothetical protein